MEAITGLARPEILAMSAYSSVRADSEQRHVSTYLDANENPYPPFPAGPDRLGLNRYPDPQPGHLLNRLAQHFSAPREQLLLTRGSDEAIDLLIRGFCAARCDAVAICPPTLGMYAFSAQIQDARVIEMPLLRSTGFNLDLGGLLLAHRVDPAIKLVFVCTPNDPTGNLLRRQDVLQLCTALFGRALVVADQTYVEYSGQEPLSSSIDEHSNLVVLRTLSKEYSLAGERLGVMIAHPEVIGILRRILAPHPLTQSAIANVTAAITPAGAEYARANIRRLVAERTRLQNAMEKLPLIYVHHSDANYLLVQVEQPDILVQRMHRAGIKICDCSTVSGIEGSVRISIGTRKENDAMLATLIQHTHAVGTDVHMEV